MDRDRLSQFVAEDYARVLAVLTHACGDRGRAEDAVQEALASALGNVRPIEDLRAWVITAALNEVRTGARRRGAEHRAHVRAGWDRKVTATTDALPVDDALTDALRALPTRQREIVALRYLLDLSVAEVAALLGVRNGTVKTQLHRARATLRTVLGDGHDHQEAGHVS